MIDGADFHRGCSNPAYQENEGNQCGDLVGYVNDESTHLGTRILTLFPECLMTIMIVWRSGWLKINLS